MKPLEKYWRVCISYFIAIVFLLSSTIISYADINDLMIGTGSNALMTLELDDSDYSVMPMSSIGSVSNTINSNSIVVQIQYTGSDGSVKYGSVVAYLQNGRYVFQHNVPSSLSGYYITLVQPRLYPVDLPSAGSYSFAYDFSSDISYDVRSFSLLTIKDNKNANTETHQLNPPFNQESGDLYVAPYNLNLTNLSQFRISHFINQSEYITTVGGSFSVNFTKIASGDYPSTAGTNTSNEDYQSGVFSSLSDLSSSVDTMTDEISGVTEAIQDLQGAMEPHYSNVLTQLHHITEQLHAFYDQVYNNIHLSELNMLTQIKEAIESIDLQIEVDISEVKTAINNMSTAVQNKLQSTTDQITGGYDNSGIVSDQTELDSALNEYQQAEDVLFEDAKEHINNFEFDTPLDAYVKPLEDISYFLTGIYNGLGGLNIPIQFSLTLTIALILIGYYRIKR